MTALQRLLRWGPYDNVREWVRGLVVTLTAASFLAFAGAFGSGRAALAPRFGYWLGLMLLGWLWGAVVSNFFFRRIGRPQALWLRILISALALSIPYSIVVGFVTVWAFGAVFRGPADAAELLLSVTVIAAVMITINVLIDRGVTGVTSASAEPPKFLERLPLKLRGAEVWAVEAEDHYLRLHTSKGQDLILMRLSDAIAELEGIEGAQVHRSWWVARDAIAEARRGDGRATLTLKDGAEAPVSRSYARVLRERGWI
ncbi:MAG TPA: LytTR family DNA-binding domain-containing protein [Phenylobacterium sp.]|nr:LytTR family DNA-binding domain-containing protein [Phenylobacterium sp.]